MKKILMFTYCINIEKERRRRRRIKKKERKKEKKVYMKYKNIYLIP